MHSRKGSKVTATCPNCKEFITGKSTGSRKDAWIECPSCGEVFEAKASKSTRQEKTHDEDEEWAFAV